MDFAGAGVHQLCARMLDHAERLPPPQLDALRVAFGLAEGLAETRRTELAILTVRTARAAATLGLSGG